MPIEEGPFEPPHWIPPDRPPASDPDSDADDDRLSLDVRAWALLPSVDREWRIRATTELEVLDRSRADSAEYNAARSWLQLFVDLAAAPRAPRWAGYRQVERALHDFYGTRLPAQADWLLNVVADREVTAGTGPRASPALRGVKPPVLCLDGPPGTGKTLFAQTAAAALGIGFARLGMGGQADSIAVRGVQRTYSRAEPGALLGAVARARRGVVLLDELDKVCSTSRRGDPTAALLEVLDPAHNHSFRDDFFDLPVDLSAVLFVATTNRAAGLSEALLDRMRVIRVPDLTRRDKESIVRRTLLPGLLAECPWLTVTEPAIAALLAGDASPGLRELERRLYDVRAAACRRKLRDNADRVELAAEDVTAMLAVPFDRGGPVRPGYL